MSLGSDRLAGFRLGATPGAFPGYTHKLQTGWRGARQTGPSAHTLDTDGRFVITAAPFQEATNTLGFISNYGTHSTFDTNNPRSPATGDANTNVIDI